MANGDKDDKKKKKQPAGGKNVRSLPTQTSGAIKPLEEVVADTGKAIGAAGKATGKFFGDVGKVVKKAVTTVPVKAPQGFDIAETIGVDAYGRDKNPVDKLLGNKGQSGFNTTAEQRARGGGSPDKTTPEEDLSDQVKTPKLFGDMGQPATGTLTDTSPQSNIKDVGSGPFGKQEIISVGKQDWEIEAEKFDRDQEAIIAAFDTDGDGVLSDQEKDDQKAFQQQEAQTQKAFDREQLLKGYKERQTAAEAQLAEINARTPTIDSDATRAAMQAAAPAKTQEDGGPKFGALGSMAQYFTELGKKGKSAPLSKNLVTSGLRRKDFASDEGFLAAVKNKNSSSQRLGAGSSLRKTPRELGSLSGAMNRAGRRLLRKGASGEAQKMFGAAERQRLTEGSNISTPERRAREEAERRQGAQLMADMQKMMEDYKKMRSNIGIAGSPDSNIQQSSRNTYGSRL
tara:strand:- start:1135 stop:2502 length:1368 start_codon:yes stop_codon:yes gene_type:complete